MRVINVSLSELESKVLLIGFEGENQITQVRIDAAEILTDYPTATPTLIVKPLFGFAYPVIVAMEGTDVVWNIDNSVMSFHGDGEIQLTFTEGTVIAKSYVGRIRIKRSLAVNGEKPDPIETWEQAATAKLAEVDAQIDELEDMVEAAEAAKDQAQDIVDDAAADIQAAGAAQVQVVQAKGTEVLNSIPSDYSTLSGDVSGLKSALTGVAAEIDGKAPAIEDVGSFAYTNTVGAIKKANVTGNSFESETIKLYDKGQFAFGNSNFISRLHQGVTFTSNGRMITLNGTATGNQNDVWISNATSAATVPDSLKGKTARVRIISDKPCTIPSATNNTQIRIYIDGTLTKSVVIGGITDDYVDATDTFDVPENASSMYMIYRYLVSGSVFSNVNLLFLFYPNDVTVYDTEETVADGQTKTVTIPNGYMMLDTGCHQNAVYEIVDTKEYVDDHVPEDAVTFDDLPYVTPEMFGAVGDDTNPDYQPLADCIAYAIANNKPIVGRGIYKIGTPIDIDGNNLSIDINGIHFSTSDSNGYAIKVRTSYSRINIRSIDSNRDGLIVSATQDTTSLRNEIRCVTIGAKITALKLTTAGAGIHYNAFYIENLYSSDGDLITGDNISAIQENYFYNSYCGCRNGWAIKDCPGRYYNFSFESACKNAIYMISGGLYTFVGCRYGELVNKKVYEIAEYDGASLADDEGTLIKVIRGNCVFIGDRAIPYACFDTSDMPDYTNTPKTPSAWKEGTLWGGFHVIAPILNGTSYLIKNGYSHLGKEMFIQAGRKICVPKYQSTYTITEADFDMRDAQTLLNNAKPYPTKMVIGVADCVIHLSDSYCSMGYSSFIVDQSDATKLCTIYDNRDATAPIFDGSELGAGVFRLDCYCDCANVSGFSGQAFVSNTTENDVWNVTKLA